MENTQDLNSNEDQHLRNKENNDNERNPMTEDRKEESISEVSSQGYEPKSEADRNVFKQNQLGLDKEDNEDEEFENHNRGNDIRNSREEADEQIKGSDADYYKGSDTNASEMNK